MVAYKRTYAAMDDDAPTEFAGIPGRGPLTEYARDITSDDYALPSHDHNALAHFAYLNMAIDSLYALADDTDEDADDEDEFPDPSAETDHRWGDYAQAQVEAHARTVAEASGRPFYRSFEYADMPRFARMRSSGRVQLELWDEALLELFGTGVRLGYMQTNLIDKVRIMMLSVFFKNDIDDNYEYLRKRFGVISLHRYLAVFYPRRSGKTVSQTIVAAVTAVSIPKGNVGCYNLTSRQARDWLSQTQHYIMRFKDSAKFNFTINKQDSREYFEIRNRWGTLSRVSSYLGGTSTANIGSSPRALCVCVCVRSLCRCLFLFPPIVDPLASIATVDMDDLLL